MPNLFHMECLLINKILIIFNNRNNNVNALLSNSLKSLILLHYSSSYDAYFALFEHVAWKLSHADLNVLDNILK